MVTKALFAGPLMAAAMASAVRDSQARDPFQRWEGMTTEERWAAQDAWYEDFQRSLEKARVERIKRYAEIEAARVAREKPIIDAAQAKRDRRNAKRLAVAKRNWQA